MVSPDAVVGVGMGIMSIVSSDAVGRTGKGAYATLERVGVGYGRLGFAGGVNEVVTVDRCSQYDPVELVLGV